MRLRATHHRLELAQETAVGLFHRGSSSLAKCNCRRTRCLRTAMFHSSEVGMPARSHCTSLCTHCCTPAYLSRPSAAGGRGRKATGRRGVEPHEYARFAVVAGEGFQKEYPYAVAVLSGRTPTPPSTAGTISSLAHEQDNLALLHCCNRCQGFRTARNHDLIGIL